MDYIYSPSTLYGVSEPFAISELTSVLPYPYFAAET